MLYLQNGNILLLETKADFLDGTDSKNKLDLSQSWIEKAGNKYNYFMVYENEPKIDHNKCLRLDKFLHNLKEYNI